MAHICCASTLLVLLLMRSLPQGTATAGVPPAEGIVVRLGWQDVAGLEAGETYSLSIPVDGQVIPFALQRFDVMATGAQVRVAGAGAGRSLDDPDLVLLRGRAAESGAARCFIAVAPRFVYGHVQVNEVLHVISSGPPAPVSGRHPVYIASGIKASGSDWVCGTETPVPEHRNDGHGQPAAAGGP